MAPKKQQSKAERFAKSSKGAAVVDIGFISFAEVANNGENMAVLGPSPIYTGTNPDLLVISKRLTKKNSSTRIKALHDLKIIIEVWIDDSKVYPL